MTKIVFIFWLWAGFVLGVSFFATPAKFLAPSISMADALEVGQVTFNLMCWVEIAFLLVLLLLIFTHKKTISSNLWVAVSLIGICLVINYIGLQPQLDKRLVLRIAGENLTKSNLHTYYIMIESIKLLALIISGWLSQSDNVNKQTITYRFPQEEDKNEHTIS